MKNLAFSIVVLLVLFSCSNQTQTNVFIEAESFGAKDGWVIDQQGFEKMGSAYLMANGMGKVIKDIHKQVDFPQGGTYHAYVRTYNWTSPWYNEKGPGKIQLLVNGKVLPTILGETGNKWEWQYAGDVKVKKNSSIGIRDLTGFYGRVDAIYFSKEKVAPTNDNDELASLRRELLGFENPIMAPESDLVVVGGGMAGMTAALSAARLGLQVTLIQNRPVLGGNNSQEVGIKLCGSLSKNKYIKIGNITREVTGIPIPVDGKDLNDFRPPKKGHDDATTALRIRLMEEEETLNLHLNTHAYAVKMDGNKITAVVTRDMFTGQETVFKGKMFVDATGDGTIGFLSGVDFHIGRENREFANEPTAPLVSDNLKMGTSVRWRSVKVKNPLPFPTVEELPWAMQCSDEYFRTEAGGRWFWETGMDKDNATEAEYVRDNALRAIFGNWAYVKNNLEGFKDREIVWLSHVGGKRESRRIMGDLVLNENDLVNAVEYPDASFTTTWSIDLHYAEEKNSKYFPGNEWITYCEQPQIEPYHVPYRTLYSKDIDNLFMAGRCISVTHVALGTVRVMATTAMMGEVVGIAASVASKNNTNPRGVYADHLDKLKEAMIKGIPTKPNELQKVPILDEDKNQTEIHGVSNQNRPDQH